MKPFHNYIFWTPSGEPIPHHSQSADTLPRKRLPTNVEQHAISPNSQSIPTTGTLFLEVAIFHDLTLLILLFHR